MFENVNRSKLTFEKYIELKGKTIVKSYTERFKWIDRFLYSFSWFGNGVSVFLAFFFLQSLFYASFNSISQSIWITFGIIFFLTMFELLKRYVFSMFSLEFIKHQFSIFKSSMISFIIGTSLLIAGSFYFSLNGAKEFVNNQKIFEKETKEVVVSQGDSIRNVYEQKKLIYVDENKSLRTVNTELRNKLSETPLNYMTARKEYQSSIDKNNEIIKNNQERIDKLDDELEMELSLLKEEESILLSSNLEENKSNIITFLIISSLIELIIVFGIYYDKYYDYRSLKDYEESVINTPEFKTWYKYNHLLELIYSSTKEVGDKIPTTDNIIEIAKISKSPITKSEFEKFVKLLYHLEIVIRDSNKRILNLPEEEGKKLLRNYFNIV